MIVVTELACDRLSWTATVPYCLPGVRKFEVSLAPVQKILFTITLRLLSPSQCDITLYDTIEGRYVAALVHKKT